MSLHTESIDRATFLRRAGSVLAVAFFRRPAVTPRFRPRERGSSTLIRVQESPRTACCPRTRLARRRESGLSKPTMPRAPTRRSSTGSSAAADVTAGRTGATDRSSCATRPSSRWNARLAATRRHSSSASHDRASRWRTSARLSTRNTVGGLRAGQVSSPWSPLRPQRPDQVRRRSPASARPDSLPTA